MKKCKHPRFGDRVLNTAAGDSNPIKYSIFVRVKRQSYKNRYGITHTNTYYECTDGQGNFWCIGPEFVELIPSTSKSASVPVERLEAKMRHFMCASVEEGKCSSEYDEGRATAFDHCAKELAELIAEYK